MRLANAAGREREHQPQSANGRSASETEVAERQQNSHGDARADPCVPAKTDGEATTSAGMTNVADAIAGSR
jgi:hypothetical protein